MAVATEIIGKLMEELRTVAKTETILGKEITVGDFTLIPVSKISLGFGAGGGKCGAVKREGEGGGGGGICVTPVAFIVIKGEEISFHGIKKGGFLDAFFEQVPELTERIINKCQQGGAGKAEPEAG